MNILDSDSQNPLMFEVKYRFLDNAKDKCLEIMQFQ